MFPHNPTLLDMINDKQLLIIEEIREGKDGKLIICASIATI